MTVTADATEVTSAVTDAVASADTVAEITADTSGAEQPLQDLGTSAREATGGLEGLKGAAEGVAGASELAAGSMAGAGSVFRAIGPEAAVAGGAILGVTGAIGELVKGAAEEQVVFDRANRIFGQSAETLKTIDVAGLSSDFETFSKQIGANSLELLNNATSFGNLTIQTGKSKEQAASLSQEFVKLGAFISANNQTLGSAADVTDGLGRALARGGRFLQQYGIDLSAADIAQRALADTGKTHTHDLSNQEKAIAGLELAYQRYGSTLGSVIVEGTKSATGQFRSMSEELRQLRDEAGKQLLEPVLATLRGLIPIAEGAIKEFADLVTPIVQVTAALADAAKAVGGLGTVFRIAVDVVTFGAPEIARGVVAIGKSLADTTVHIDENSTALDRYYAHVKGVDTSTRDTSRAVGEMAGLWSTDAAATGDMTAALAGQEHVLGSVHDRMKEVSDVLGGLGVDFSSVQTAAADLGGQFDFQAGQAANDTKAINDQVKALGDLFDAQHRGVTSATTILEADLRRTEAIDKANKATDGVAKAEENLAKVRASGKSDALDISVAEDTLVQARDKEAQANLASIQSTDDLNKKLIDYAAAVNAGTITTGQAEAQLRQVAAASGLSADQIDGLIATLQRLGPQAAGQFNQVVTAAQNTTADLATLSTFDPGFAVGTNFGAGFVAGIDAHQFAVQAAASRLALIATDAANVTLGALSPSKVMQQTGQWFAQGLAIGIGDETAAVAAAGAAAAAAAVTGASLALQEALGARAGGTATPQQLSLAGGDDERRRANQASLLFDQLTTEAKIGLLDQEIAAETQYTDRYTQLVRQRDQLVQTELQTRQQAITTAASTLEQLLSQEKAINDRRAQETQAVEDAITKTHQDAADKIRAVRAKEATDLDAETAKVKQAFDARVTSLEGFASISQRAIIDPGVSISRLLGNADKQNQQLAEFTTDLATLRARGVSDATIAALGLDKGPQALGQLRKLLTASTDDLVKLNADLVERSRLAAVQATIDTAPLRQQVAAESAVIHAQAERDAETIRQEELAADRRFEQVFQEQIRQDNAQLAALGRSAGEKYGDELAQAAKSKVPAVTDAGRALFVALQEATSQGGVTTSTDAFQGATINITVNNAGTDSKTQAQAVR